MTGELKLQGAFNIGVQGVAQGAEVNITQILANSYQYNDLVDQINLHKELLSLTPVDKIEKRLNLSEKINSLEAQIEQFKKDILRLAEQFERIEINTDRLIRAKEHFDKGEIAEARAIFEAESVAMQNDQNRLLEKREEYEENILPKLRNNAEEYLLSALLSITDYNNPNRFNEAVEKFELSIKSLETKVNLFEYATFLMVLSRVEDAEEIYGRYLKKFSYELVGEEFINIYVNLGLVYFQIHDFPKAENSLNLALEMLNQKSAESFPNYKYCLAAANANLAVLLQYQTKYEESYKKYIEAIKIFKELAEKDSEKHLPLLADVQSNLGYFLRLIYVQNIADNKIDKAVEIYKEAEASMNEAQRNIEKFEEKYNLFLPSVAINNALNYGNLLLEKSEFDRAKSEYEYGLKVIEKYLVENPQTYLPKKAVILNSFGVVTEREGKLEESQKYFEDALNISIELLKIEPQAHLVEYCMFLINVADSYCETKTNREDSINGAVEVIAILYPAMETLAYTKEFVEKAMGVLKKWDLSLEEVTKMVEERMNQLQISQ